MPGKKKKIDMQIQHNLSGEPGKISDSHLFLWPDEDDDEILSETSE